MTSLPSLNAFQMIAKRMDYATEAMKLAAENMTHEHTPNYKARRLERLTFNETVACNELKQTHPKHMSTQTANGFRVREKSGGQENFSGNSVSRSEELQNANEANMSHKQMSHLIQAFAHMIEMPLKR